MSEMIISGRPPLKNYETTGVNGKELATEDKQNDILTSEGDKLHNYKLSDVEEGATYTYLGYLAKDGSWYIVRIENDKTFRYVKGSSGYDWSDRASLTYDTFDNVF